MLHGRRQAFPAKNWLVASARSAQTAHRLHAYGRRACAPIRTATHSLACRPRPSVGPDAGRADGRSLAAFAFQLFSTPPSCALCVTILKGPSRNFRKGTCSGLPRFCCFSVTFYSFSIALQLSCSRSYVFPLGTYIHPVYERSPPRARGVDYIGRRSSFNNHNT